MREDAARIARAGNPVKFIHQVQSVRTALRHATRTSFLELPNPRTDNWMHPYCKLMARWRLVVQVLIAVNPFCVQLTRDHGLVTTVRLGRYPFAARG